MVAGIPFCLLMSDLLNIEERNELERCEIVIKQGLQTFVEVGQALMLIREKKLYRGKHGTFENYCREKWNMHDRNARRLINAANVFENIETGPRGPVLPQNEKHARPLTKLEPELQSEVWQEVVERHGEKITHNKVEEVVKEFKPLDNELKLAKKEPMFAQMSEKEILSRAKEIKEQKSIEKQIERNRKIEQIKSTKTPSSLEDVTILEGDVFEMIKSIPDESVDLLNTDPPYKILQEDWDEFESKQLFLDFTEKWLKAVMPKVKKTGRVYISFSQWYQYDFYEILKKNDFFGFNFKQNIIWYYKNNNRPSNRKEYRYMFEPIFYLYGKDADVLNFTADTYGETQQNVWEIATPQSNFKEGKFHPAQKPLELYRRIVKTGSKEGDTVLDCFAGSGTTGVICKELNRKVILIEKEIENVKIIKGRICLLKN